MRHLERFIQLVAPMVLVFSVVASNGMAQESKESKDKMRTRLEQLFIWRVSDRLQLTPEEEAKFTAEYKKLSEDRTAATQKIDDISNKLADEKADKKTKAKLVSEYEEANKKYIQLQEDELKVMKRLFNTDKLADYILLKREMFHKFREALNTSKSTAVAETPDKPKLKEPEVFQEK